ncbi:hypothetical protein [Oleisolibacter albus]|uniref:hypothetical protein n=1 Tax=Oleisolibacter albus TaxID=2171757 RepID=UPI0012D7635C|nr:hypothetical protein [Oleisolibacter albus]
MLVRGADGRLYEVTPAGVRVVAEALPSEAPHSDHQDAPVFDLTAGADFVNPRFP